MQANLITLIRVAMVFLVIGLFQFGFAASIAAALLIIVVLYMDALDGIIARRLKITSDLGAMFDITGDRIVENVFWVYFAAIGMVSFWAAAIVIARSFLVDWLRTLAFANEGQTPFGEKTMMRSRWAMALVNSRFSRALYGFTKAIVFVYLGGLIVLRYGIADGIWVLPADAVTAATLIGRVIVWVTVAMCVVRGVPVAWDSKEILRDKMFPGLIR